MNSHSGSGRDPRDDAHDVDRAFADIISHWGETAQRSAGPGAAGTAGPAGTARGDHQGSTSTPPRRPRTVEEVFGAGGSSGWRVHIPPEEPEEDYVPPPPAPLPRHDPAFWGALAGLAGGPLWLIWLSVVATGARPIWSWLAIAITLTGFALVVLRLPARRDPGHDQDDGAIV